MGPQPVNFVHPLLRARDYQNRPEFDRLCDWWRRGGQGVCALVGIGGAGKTAVADRFLRVLPGAMADDPNLPKDDTLPPPGGLIVFSFYDAPNPDKFVAGLAAWLEGRPPDDAAKTYSYEQMVRLLQGAGDCLLVMDGLEKVQDTGARGGAFGRITDGRLRDFVLRVAEGNFRGIGIIITTRFPMPHLEEERPPNYATIPIDEISEQTGIDLLRVRGVQGTDLELRRVVNECGCHALTVDMAGGYIGEFGGGDPNTKLELGTAEELEEAIKDEPDARRRRVLKQEFRFARIARRYHEGFSESDPAALALLQRVCLFRLGIEAKTLASIFTGEGKEGISGPELAVLNENELRAKLKLLVEMRLLEASEPAGDESSIINRQSSIYTVHPAVRDGFLAGLDADTAQRGHDAAREGLEASLGGQSGDNPSDPATLDLLEEIVHHTLAAGHANKAWDVYRNRIGGGRNLMWRLGAYERGERICRAFVGGRPPQTAPLPEGLPENLRAIFINEWALYLRELGLLDAVARCYERYIRSSLERDDWTNASIGNQNLADVFLPAGRLTAGLQAAEEALRLADSADDAHERCCSHAFRGHARALRGEGKAALANFRDALRCQHKAEGKSDRSLWSLRGIQHSLLLIRLAQHEEATRLANANKKLCIEYFGDENQDNINLVLADLARERGDLPAARELLAEAHEWAIARDAKEPLCWSALVRAKIELSRVRCADQSRGADAPNGPHSEPYDEARAAIEDGLRIARDCGYGIFNIDLLLLRAQVALREGRPADAERDVRLALDEGVHPPADTGLPELLAATDEECGYAWGIGDARHLLAEALLLQAAQKLGKAEFAPARFDCLPANVKKLIEGAREQLTQCRDLRKRIQDPKQKDTQEVLDRLKGGVLTDSPLKQVEFAEPPAATEGSSAVSDAKLTAKDIFLGAGNAAFAAGVVATGAVSLPAAVVGSFAFQCLQQLWAKRREGRELQPTELAQQTDALREALLELGIDVDRNLDHIRGALELLGTSVNDLGDEVDVLREMHGQHAQSIDGLLSIADQHEAAIRALTEAAKRAKGPASVKAALTADVLLAPYVDGDTMVDTLRACPAGVFKLVVRYLRFPAGAMSGEKASQAERAVDLMDWVESPDGPGLGALYEAYKRANRSGGALTS